MVKNKKIPIDNYISDMVSSLVKEYPCLNGLDQTSLYDKIRAVYREGMDDGIKYHGINFICGLVDYLSESKIPEPTIELINEVRGNVV